MEFLANPIAATTYSKEGKESEARTGGWEWVVRDTQKSLRHAPPFTELVAWRGTTR